MLLQGPLHMHFSNTLSVHHCQNALLAIPLLIMFVSFAGGGPLELQGSKAGLHAEEQEEGEERPGLLSVERQ
jgi:hypothetical protein